MILPRKIRMISPRTPGESAEGWEQVDLTHGRLHVTRAKNVTAFISSRLHLGAEGKVEDKGERNASWQSERDRWDID
jgi:hypothetical protein